MTARCIFLFLLVSAGTPQSLSPQTDQDVAESILENSLHEGEVQQIGEDLEFLQAHPFDISKPSYGDLLRLPFISPLLAEAIILYTDTVTVTEISQLMEVPLMTGEILQNLTPFVRIGDASAFSTAILFLPNEVRSRSRVERKVQLSEAYLQRRYRGDRNGVYQRLSVGNDFAKIGAVWEKDPGERPGDGFLSGYLESKNISILDHAVIGRYTFAAGQGLVFAKNISSSKGGDVVSQPRKGGREISPSTSIDEFRYFFGSAAKVSLGAISVAAMTSDRRLPATTDSSGRATGFFTSGLYRTESELMKRDVVRERVSGGLVSLNGDEGQSVSFAALRAWYDEPLDPGFLKMNGRTTVTVSSLSWKTKFYGMHSYGEIASNDAKRFNSSMGFILPVSHAFALGYHRRSLSESVAAPFARPFAERTAQDMSERGEYLGMEIHLGQFSLHAYTDLYALSAAYDGFGSIGFDMFLRAEYRPSRTIHATVQVRRKNTVREIERNQSNYRISWTLRPLSTLTFSHRIEMVEISYRPEHSQEMGFLSFVEGKYRGKGGKITVRSRLSYFQTPSYDSRVYQYESDVAGNYANPPLYGTGVRWYIVAAAETIFGLIFSMKYSETMKLHETMLGSGWDEISGNLDNSITLQIDFRL